MADEREERAAPAGASGPAFAAAAGDPALHEELRDYLLRQSELATIQIDEARREDVVRHWSLRVRHVSDVLKLGLELAAAFIVLVIALGIGFAIWQAAHADGLVIRSFDVPAPMVEKGLTGQVIANKLLDRLTVMQNQTDSSRAASSFANDWTDDIKVQIPDTGVSLGQVVRFLDDWLGHQMHLSGELYQTDTGIVLTVRMDNDPGQTFEGKAGDVNDVVARAAEAVFARAQPYRYGVYLASHGRFAEAFAAFRVLADNGPRNEVAWADVGLALIAKGKGDLNDARSYLEAGRAANPDLPNVDGVLESIGNSLGHSEAEFQAMRRFEKLIRGPGAHEWNPAHIPAAVASAESGQAYMQGDYSQANAKDAMVPGSGGSEGLITDFAFGASDMHDIAAARGYISKLDALPADSSPLSSSQVDAPGARAALLIELQDWRGALVQLDAAAAAQRRIETDSKGWRVATYVLRTQVLPYEAYARAMLGEFDKADASLKTLPDDCDICARMHGRVEAARHNWNAAAHWFALVSVRSPDIPFADTDWGRMLLAKGDLDGAIARFTVANRKSPHFADPLEMWGEALIAKNRSDLALAKLEQANKYAPNWGRLHLKWGEALLWSGDKAGAAKQFAIASQLDLTSSERSEFARMRGIHG